MKILDFLHKRELKLSPLISSVALFTPDTKDANIIPKVIIDGKPVKLDKNPKIGPKSNIGSNSKIGSKSKKWIKIQKKNQNQK